MKNFIKYSLDSVQLDRLEKEQKGIKRELHLLCMKIFMMQKMQYKILMVSMLVGDIWLHFITVPKEFS